MRKSNKGKAETDKTNDIRVRMFFAVITFLIGGGLLIVRYNTITGLADAENWPSTPCTIEKSEFIQGDEGGRWLEFTYRYEVNGISYTGDRLDMVPGQMGNDGAWEAQIFKDHPVGSTATCYVDPSNPVRSVFDNQHGAADSPNLLLLSLPFLAIGTVFLFSVYWSLSNAEAMKLAADTSKSQFDPTPRRLTLKQILGVLMVPKATLFAMAFFLGFMLVFRMLDGPAIIGDWLPASTIETLGTIEKINTTGHNQFNGKVLEYKFDYQFKDKRYKGTSYSVNDKHEVGDEIIVLIDTDDLDRTRIRGFRRRAVSFLVALIPAGVLALLAFGIVASCLTSITSLRLFRRGEVAEAKLMFVEDTGVVNPNTRHTFEVGDTQFSVNGRSMLTADMKTAFVLYDPEHPARNIGLSVEKTALLAKGLSIWKVLLFSIIPPIACTAAAIWIWNI